MKDEQLNKANQIKEELKSLNSLLDSLNSFHEIVLSNKNKKKETSLYYKHKCGKELYQLTLPDCVRVEVKKCVQAEIDRLKQEYDRI